MGYVLSWITLVQYLYTNIGMVALVELDGGVLQCGWGPPLEYFVEVCMRAGGEFAQPFEAAATYGPLECGDSRAVLGRQVPSGLAARLYPSLFVAYCGCVELFKS